MSSNTATKVTVRYDFTGASMATRNISSEEITTPESMREPHRYSTA